MKHFCFSSFLFLILSSSCLFSQITNEGIVYFNTFTIDTINGVTTSLPDSMQHRYYFKGNNYRTFYGTDSVNNSVIVNGHGTLTLNVTYGSKMYSFDSIPVNAQPDSLLNFWDTTSVRYMITHQHKDINGYDCALGYFFYLSFNYELSAYDTTNVVAFWFTNQIKGNNLIPGAGQTTLNLNGLILEYDTPVPNGLQIVSCQSLLLQAVDDVIFYPNLTGYINSSSGGN